MTAVYELLFASRLELCQTDDFYDKARKIMYSLLLLGCLQSKQHIWTATTSAVFCTVLEY